MTKLRFLLIFCTLIFLIVGGIYSSYLGPHLIYWDEESYLILSSHLHQGSFSADGIHPTAFEPPGYPFFLFLLSFISPNPIFLRFCNFILLSLCAALCYFISKNWGTEKSAFFAFFIALIYPLFIYTAGKLYPQIFASFLLLLTITFLFYEKKWNYACLAGIVFGYLILTVPIFLAFLLFVATFPFFLRSNDRFRKIVCFIACCSIVVGSWTLRNYLVFDRFILISTNEGVNFLIGNSENTLANSGVNVDISSYLQQADGMDEIDKSNFLRREAFKWIFSHPKEAISLYLLKVLNYFNFSPNLATKGESSSFVNFLLFISFYPLLAILIFRFFKHLEFVFNRYELFLLMLYLASPWILAIFFTRIRFRIPFDFLLILLTMPLLAKLEIKKRRNIQE